MSNAFAHLGLSGRPDRTIMMVIEGNTICKSTGTKNAAEPLFVPRPKFVHWEINKPVAVKTNSNPEIRGQLSSGSGLRFCTYPCGNLAISVELSRLAIQLYGPISRMMIYGN